MVKSITQKGIIYKLRNDEAKIICVLQEEKCMFLSSSADKLSHSCLKGQKNFIADQNKKIKGGWPGCPWHKSDVL
jgi:hypothetical protein